MENVNNSADSAPNKSLKARKSNARKSRKKKFTRAKRRVVERRTKVASRQEHGGTQEQQSTTCQSDDQDMVEQMSDCSPHDADLLMSDCSTHDADLLNMSGLAELPSDDEGRLNSCLDNNAVKDPCDGNTLSCDESHQKASENALMTSGEMDDALMTLDGNTPFCDEPQPKTLRNNVTSSDTSGEMVMEGVFDCTSLVEIRMDNADSVTIKRVKRAPVVETPSGERFAEPVTITPRVPTGPPIIPHVGQFRYSERDQMTALLERVRVQLITTLPSLWLPMVKTDGTHVGLCAENASFVIQRSLFVRPDGTVSVEVHGRDLSPDHCYWKNVKTVPLSPDSVDDFANNVLQMVHALASLEMCTGVEKFEHFWKRAVNCEVDSNLFHETNYKKTCRSTFCPLLVEKRKNSRCDACSRVFKVFSLRERRRSKKETDSPAKFAANCYLTTPQQRKRLRTKNAQLRAERQRNSQLTQRINALVAEEGLEIDGNTADDVTKILETAKSAPGLTDLQLLFIEEQLKAAKARPHGMKWHPAIIRFALAIRMASPAAYNELSGVLKLPSERQLFDYSHAVSPRGTQNSFNFSHVLAEAMEEQNISEREK